ncbi:MAG: gephyrin-like molybdotransferase Glp [Bacillota bacterium]
MKLFQVDSVDEVKKKIDQYFHDIALECETVHITEALGSVLYEPIYAPICLPEFDRSTVDGYALQTKDTFGASESLPTFLNIIGKVEMGKEARYQVRSGEAVYVPTGGMMPQGADGVVMIEYVENLDQSTIAVYRSVSPGDGMIRRSEDIKTEQLMLNKGRILKPQDIGGLAAVGITEIKVFKKPRVSILSTGDEIVDPTALVKPGQIRDINTYALAAMVKEMGGEVIFTKVIHDDYEMIRSHVAEAVENSDIVIISGGSSVGTKDVTAKVIDSMGDPGVFVHGVAIKPGKPTIIGKAKGAAVFGLPGHPVSAMVVFRIFGGYLMNKLLSLYDKQQFDIDAVSEVNIPSSPGKETYQMVTIEERDGMYVAIPIHGKSGAISLMMKSHGYIRIAGGKEGIQKGERVKVVIL